MAASDLDWQAWVVIATLVVALVIMAGDWAGPDLVFTMLTAFYMASTIITVSQGATNYGNTGLLTVIKLYMVAEGIYQTGALEWIMTKILGQSRSAFWALVRMMIPTMFLSAFLNNTPVVSILTPILISWAKRSGVPAKKLLIPLSYAAVLGGTCTLIGTSTNLVVAGAQATRYKNKDPAAVQFGIFDIAPYGVPYAIWGFLFVILTQRWLLPGNASKYARNLLLALRPQSHSPIIGQTLADAGLTKVHDTPLVAVLSKHGFTRDFSPLSLVGENDVFYFAGEIENVIVAAEELGLNVVNCDNEEGGVSVVDSLINAATAKVYHLLQVTITDDSNLIGLAVRDANVRRRFDITVVGIQRNSKRRADSKLNDIVLAAGDILLIDQGPTTNTASEDFTAQFKDVHVVIDSKANMFVTAYRATNFEMVGKTVSQAGLRGIPGIYVIALDPAGEAERRLEPVDHHTRIQKNDVLWVAADVSGIHFLSRLPGLELAAQDQVNKSKVSILDQHLTQVVIAANSGLVGKTVVDAGFRKKYKATVVAYQRDGHIAPTDIRNLVLQPGDVLLLSASEKWQSTHRSDRNFVLINDVPNSAPPKKNRALIAAFLGVAMVLTQIIPGVRNEKDWIHLWPCASLTTGLMLLTGCLSGDQARKSILWDVYLCIAAAFGVSTAMETTGVAREFAGLFITIARQIGSEGAGLVAVYVATALLSEILTNNASGAIMYPIAAIAGDQLGISPERMSIAIMLGASAGFINPFSYQTNLMVYVAGNYRTREFAKIGAPFQLYLLIVSSFILCFMDYWTVVWIVSFVVAGAVIIPPFLWEVLPARYTGPIEERVMRFFSRRRGRVDYGAVTRSDSGDNLDRVTSRASSTSGDDKKPVVSLGLSLRNNAH